MHWIKSSTKEEEKKNNEEENESNSDEDSIDFEEILDRPGTMLSWSFFVKNKRGKVTPIWKFHRF